MSIRSYNSKINDAISKNYYLVFFFSAFFFSARSQESAGLLNHLIREDSAAVTALALYPEGIRKNILEACTYPEALVRMEALQKSTSESFKNELAGYSKEEQQKVWDLARYPDLVAKLSEGEKKSKEEVEKIVLDYPAEIRETAADLGQNHYELLGKVNSLNKNSENAFQTLIQNYPVQIRSSLQALLSYPEVINILTSGMKMTVLVGDIYKKQPQLVEHKLDSISTEHAQQNAKDLEEWQSGLEKNPEAKKEMEQAANEFTKEQGYKEDDLMRNETVVVNYVIHPYPYWYGYPWWYNYPYWYPYPYWYDLGYYWSPQGIVYTGFPSPYFTYWYFHHHSHHYHYNHFSDYCVGYYYGHHRSVTGFHREVSNWVKENEPNLPRDFFANDGSRPGRIKEFGKFEIEYDKAVKENPGKTISRDDFLQENASVYPSITPKFSEPKVVKEKPTNVKPKQPSIYQSQPKSRPIIKTPREPKPVQPPITPKQKPLQPKPQPVPNQPKSYPKKSPRSEMNTTKDDFARMNEAQDFHRSEWNDK